MKVSPVREAPDMVISTDCGHLFLTGDGNSCHDQHLGRVFFDQEVLAKWRDHIAYFCALQRDRGGGFCFLPAPDKQSVYWEKLSALPDNRNILSLLGLISPDLYYDPLPSLKAVVAKNAGDPYPKTDSHWSAVGAQVAVEGVLQRLGICIDLSFASKHYKEYRIEGDLGRKLIPIAYSDDVRVNDALWRKLLFYDNGVPDNGRVRVFYNMDSLVRGRVLILGDSFSYRLVELMSIIFQTVFHFHGNFLDPGYFWLAQPDYFVFEQTDRFFLRGPRYSNGSDFSGLVDEKLRAGVDVANSVETFRRVANPDAPDMHVAGVVYRSDCMLARMGIIDSPRGLTGYHEFVRAVGGLNV